MKGFEKEFELVSETIEMIETVINKKKKKQNEEEVLNLLICVSGGRSSARMARKIQLSKKYRKYNKLYVFCNTGMEDEKNNPIFERYGRKLGS